MLFVYEEEMARHESITIRLSRELSEKLDHLARQTGRQPSALAIEAVTTYVERELPIVESIQRGLADVRAGRVTPHPEVMDSIDALIAAAQRPES
jgi:predicted transcriptional regulator